MADAGDDEEQDLYTLFNVDRSATQADIKRAYNKLSRIFHPDRHRDPDKKREAEEQFPEIQRAYSILSDEQQRAIYDVYGMKGIEAGAELADYCTTREEIRAECRAREQLAKERREMQLADAKSQMEICLDGRRWFDPHATTDLELEVSEMTISQSINTRVGRSDTVLWQGILNAERGRGAGQGSVALQHTFDPSLTGELELFAGAGMLGSIGASKHMSQELDISGSLKALQGANGAELGVEMSAVRSLTQNVYGLLQWQQMPNSMYMRTGLIFENQDYAAAAFAQLGLPDSHVSARMEAAVDKETRLKASFKWGILDTKISYGGERWILDEDNRVSATVSLGTTSGVQVKIKYNRRSQLYAIPIQFSDLVSWDVALVATVLPLAAYVCVQQVVISPYLRREEKRERAEKRRANRGKLQRARQSAVNQQGLMRETVRRKADSEEAVGGLVILQAYYGQLAAHVDEFDDDLPLVFDVTVPMQYAVESHRLLLPRTPKGALPGFYDPCPGEPKSLRVQYRFKGSLHEVTVGDEDELKCPREGHKLRGNAPR